MIIPITPLSQTDKRWNKNSIGSNPKASIGNEGSILVCMAMLLTYYSHPILPDQLNQILTERNLYYDGYLFANDSIFKIYPDIIYDKVVWCENNLPPLEEIKHYIFNKKPVVVALLEENQRYYALVVGVKGNNLIINDPISGTQREVSYLKTVQVNFFSGPNVHLKDTQVAYENQNELQTFKKTNEGLQMALANMQNDIEKLENQLKESQEDKEFLLVESLQANSRSKKFPIRLSLIITLLASAIALLNPLLNWGFSLEEILIILLPLLLYILIEGMLEIVEKSTTNLKAYSKKA